MFSVFGILHTRTKNPKLIHWNGNSKPWKRPTTFYKEWVRYRVPNPSPQSCEDSAKLTPSTNVHDGDNRKKTTMAMMVVVMLGMMMMLVMMLMVMMMVVV